MSALGSLLAITAPPFPPLDFLRTATILPASTPSPLHDVTASTTSHHHHYITAQHSKPTFLIPSLKRFVFSSSSFSSGYTYIHTYALHRAATADYDIFLGHTSDSSELFKGGRPRGRSFRCFLPCPGRLGHLLGFGVTVLGRWVEADREGGCFVQTVVRGWVGDGVVIYSELGG